MAAPLRFFVVSQYGEGLCLALRLHREGHRVSLYNEKPEARYVGLGLVDRVDSIAPPKGAIVVFTSTTFSRLGRMFRRRGHLVFGGNDLETVELDRAAGTRLMHDCGVSTPETHSFSKIADAQRFLEREDGAWFFKPDNAPSGMTRNAPSSDSMIRWLRFVEPQLKSSKFELQRKVDGIEVDVDVWCDGSKIVLPNDVDLEEKKLLVGELGPRTGCQSNLVFPTRDPIIETTIAPFYDALVSSRYCGLFSINTIVAKSGDVYGLEFTARLGFDATEAWLSLVPSDLGEQMAEFCAGGLSAWNVLPDYPFALTLHLSIPPYPLDDTRALAKTRGTPLDEKLLEDERFYPYDVMRTGDGLVAAGADGSVGVLTEVGHSITQLRKRLLERAEAFDIPQVQYRTDIVKSAEERLDALVRMGLVEREPKLTPPAIDFEDELGRAKDEARRERREDDSDDGLSPGETEPQLGAVPDHHNPTSHAGSAQAGPGASGAGVANAASTASDGAAPAP